MDGAPAATTSCAGLSDHWPAGRGLWHADDFSLVVWICGEEHVRIVGTAGVGTMEGMDAVDACSMAFGTVRDALAQISETLPFELNQELGYVTANLATIGTGMRVSIGVKGLDHICPRVADVCDELWMEAQPVKQVQGSFIVSSSITLGISSKDVVRLHGECKVCCIKSSILNRLLPASSGIQWTA
jgi:protein-arginine kinase